MKIVQGKRSFKITTTYLDATKTPSVAHFNLEQINVNNLDLDTCYYKKHTLVLPLDSPFYKPLIEAWENKRTFKLCAKFARNYNEQATNITDVKCFDIVND